MREVRPPDLGGLIAWSNILLSWTSGPSSNAAGSSMGPPTPGDPGLRGTRPNGSLRQAFDGKCAKCRVLVWKRDSSCFDQLLPCLSQFYCWLPRRIRQQRRGYASGGIFTTAEADYTTTESTRKQVPCGPGERSRQSHMGQELPPICIRPAIRFIANTPLATRAGVVSSVVVRAIPI